jgi:cyanate permease
MHPDGKELLKGKDDPDGHDTIQEFNMSLGEAMKTKTFWFLLLAGSSQPLIGTALTFHQVSLLAGKGISPEIAASVFAIIAPFQIAGTFLSGFLSDRFSNRHLLAFGQILLAVMMLFTFLISSTWHAFVYGALAGLSAGSIMTALTVIWPNYYGRRHLGSIRGVAAASMASFAAVGPLPFGWIFDITGSYSMAILVFLTLPVLCAIMAVLAKPPQKRYNE